MILGSLTIRSTAVAVAGGRAYAKQVMVPGMVRTVSAAVGAVYVGDGAALVDVVTLVP